jgi:hypothetical protein
LLLLSELSKDEDELDDKDSESDEEVGSSMAALSRASRSFLKGFEMQPITIHNSNRLSHCVFYKKLLSNKFAFQFTFHPTAILYAKHCK